MEEEVKITITTGIIIKIIKIIIIIKTAIVMNQTIILYRGLNAHLMKMNHTKGRLKKEIPFIGVRNVKGGHFIPLENMKLQNS